MNVAAKIISTRKLTTGGEVRQYEISVDHHCIGVTDCFLNKGYRKIWKVYDATLSGYVVEFPSIKKVVSYLLSNPQSNCGKCHRKYVRKGNEIRCKCGAVVVLE